jgi:haloalkane dehalogenase
MRIDFTPDPALYTFTSRWFDSSRGRVHYVDEGSGPVILLFHGNLVRRETDSGRNR